MARRRTPAAGARRRRLVAAWSAVTLLKSAPWTSKPSDQLGAAATSAVFPEWASDGGTTRTFCAGRGHPAVFVWMAWGRVPPATAPPPRPPYPIRGPCWSSIRCGAVVGPAGGTPPCATAARDIRPRAPRTHPGVASLPLPRRASDRPPRALSTSAPVAPAAPLPRPRRAPRVPPGCPARLRSTPRAAPRLVWRRRLRRAHLRPPATHRPPPPSRAGTRRDHRDHRHRTRHRPFPPVPPRLPLHGSRKAGTPRGRRSAAVAAPRWSAAGRRGQRCPTL